MAQIDTLKTYLQIDDSSIDEQLQLILDMAEKEYIHRTHQAEADEDIVIEMAVERYNQFGNEGLTSISYSGINEVFSSDYSDRVAKLIRSKTKMVTL